VHAVIISVYRLMVSLHLTNTYYGLISVYVAFGIPFSVVILQAYFRSFQQEMIDAARIDGCSDLGAFWRVVFPVSLGAISTVIIVNFIVVWNEFLFALVFTMESAKTLPVITSEFIGVFEISWSQLAAAAVTTSIPILVFILIFQKRLISGLTQGAIKG
jgi:multiple sugar transport system permease protein